ncbi:MAG: hypothetical protein ACOVO1_12260 [Chitinophagaceae bacterium]
MKRILFFIFLLSYITANAQFKKISIRKKGKEKFSYSLGFPIKLLTKNDSLVFGMIHFITTDSITLNVFDKVAMADIKSIEPLVKNKLQSTKIKSIEEGAVGVLMSLAAIATFDAESMIDIWFQNVEDKAYSNYGYDDSKLNNKQKRNFKKRWSKKEFEFIVE